MVGVTPYIGLQIKAIIKSFEIISHEPRGGAAMGLVITLFLGGFAIIFGARRLDSSERHGGLVFAVAFESLVKLLAFLLVGLFVTYGVFDGFGDIFARIDRTPFAALRTMAGGGEAAYSEWLALLVLSMMAILFLPRQFQMAVIENVDLGKPLDHEEVAAIRAALLAHKVIFFEDQHISATEHRDFAARFGALHTHPLYPGVPEAPELFILDNHANNPTDNDAWHTDVTFLERPDLGSILYAVEVPEVGVEAVEDLEDLVVIGDVERADLDAAVGVLREDLLAKLLEPVEATGAERKVVAEVGELAGHLRAQPRARAGDQDRLGHQWS